MRQLWIFTAAALIIAASGAGGQEVRGGNIAIVDPVVQAMPAGARIGGGYMTIVNHGAEEDVLLGGSAERAGALQPRRRTLDNGVTVMRSIKGGLPIPAGATVALTPGGDHLMFLDVAQAFQPGETIRAVLRFQKAGDVEVRFTVGPAAGQIGSKPDGASGMMMDGMPMEGMPMTGNTGGHAGHGQ